MGASAYSFAGPDGDYFHTVVGVVKKGAQEARYPNPYVLNGHWVLNPNTKSP